MSDLLDKFKAFEEEQKAEVKSAEKSVGNKKFPTENKPKKSIKILDNVFKDMTITQDDLWFLYRLKTGNGTRTPKRKLLPQFTEVFRENLEKLKRKEKSWVIECLK